MSDRPLKILCFVADFGGCYEYRIRIPLEHQRKHNVDYYPCAVLPNNPWTSDFVNMMNFMMPYDLIMVQRTNELDVVFFVKRICELLNKPMVYETDDDYLNIPRENPCAPSFSTPQALAAWKEILRMSDMVTVTTPELRNIVYPYNKNVRVFPNNVERVHDFRDYIPEEYYEKGHAKEGQIKITQAHGLPRVPAFKTKYDPNTKKEISEKRIIRIGYSATESHRHEFKTISYQWEKLIAKYWDKIFVVYIGDLWYYQNMDRKAKSFNRTVPIQASTYPFYMNHLRNLDIAIAPLRPNIFNMSKSPIKAIEAASWGIPSVLPNYVTYTREFTHDKNCLTYNTGKEFYDCMEELINNTQMREELGFEAREHIRHNRLEILHTQERYDAYRELVEKFPVIKIFQPDKKEVASAA